MEMATIYQVFQVYTPLSLFFLEFEHIHDLLCFCLHTHYCEVCIPSYHTGITICHQKYYVANQMAECMSHHGVEKQIAVPHLFATTQTLAYNLEIESICTIHMAS